MSQQRVVISKEIKRIFQIVRSSIKMRNNMGLRTLPWGTPTLTGRGDERALLRATCCLLRVEEVSNPRVDFSLDSIGRQFREQGRMSDCIKGSRYVQRDCPDLMSDIEGPIHCWESRSSMVKVE